MLATARQLIGRNREIHSVTLSCSQHWNDEADDAVQEEVHVSPSLFEIGDGARADWDIQREVLQWRSNNEAMWAFSAQCSEEGWEEETGAVTGPKNVYRALYSPLMIVQRDGEQLRGTWLGRPLRAWLDFPSSHQDREYRDRPTLELDPEPAELSGRERELWEAVGPDDRGPRDVLRDLWIERDDPRGTYSVASDPATLDRDVAAELIAAHGRSWLGALQPIVPLSGALFGYGPFLRRVIVYGTREQFEALRDAPEWRTLESIEFAVGSARLLLASWKHVHAIGPLGLPDLGPLREPGWQIRDLDLEIDRDPEKLATLELPLEILRLRPARSLDVTAWISKLGTLATAPWWSTLQRLEVWLPGGHDDQAGEIVRVATQLAAVLPEKTTAVGMLDANQRTGWMLVGDRLELAHPDPRFTLGPALAKATGLPLTPALLQQDDWLTFALGVGSIRPL